MSWRKMPNTILSFTAPNSTLRHRALDIESRFPKRAYFDALAHAMAASTDEYDRTLEDGSFLDHMEEELKRWK